MALGARAARCAATERKSSLAMAFLYWRSVFHQMPPPQVLSQAPVMVLKMEMAVARYWG